jgi:hypothetical protein
MKNCSLVFFLSLALLTCNHPTDKQEPAQYAEYKFTTESAEKAIGIARLLLDNKNVSDEDWEKLFNSEGYKNYLIYSNSLAQKNSIKDALETVFDPDKQHELDSLLSLPVVMDKNFYRLTLIRNFNQLKRNLDKAEEFIQEDFNSLISAGDSLARLFLPSAMLDSLPRLYDCHFILSDPDAKVMEDAIVFDLNMAVEKGKDELIKIIAHEFHHNYRKLTTPSYTHPLMVEINKLHQEGVADLIDKDQPPIKEALYPKTFIDAYNLSFAETPKKLNLLDSITQKFLAQQMDTLAYYSQLENFFAFGGHPNGFYMALETAKNKGPQVLIDSYNDPVKFIRIYNDVAKSSTGNHVFSPEFINYLIQLEERLTQKD